MIGRQPFSVSEKWFILSGILLLIFSFYYQLGIYPLFLEEPRRGLIALEMIFQDNLWVPTQTGDLYFRKPPVYNWLLIASYKLFGGYTEFATRFFSVLSHITLCILTFRFVKKYTDQTVAVLASLSLLVSVDILFYFSTLGEIDLFYALITASSMFAVYYFGERQQYWWLFSVVYFLTAIGFLTKGLTSLPFTAITLLVYFIYKKDFKQLLRLPHFSGIALFVLLAGGYFYQYSQYHDPSGWWTTLFSESADKATGGGFFGFLKHLVYYPLDTVKNILPAGLLLPLLFRKGIREKLSSNPFIWYCTLVFIFNFIVYWFSTEAKSRYIYSLFPFIITVLIWLGVNSESRFTAKGLKIFLITILCVFTIGVFAIPFVEALEVVSNRIVVSAIILGLLIPLWYLSFRKNVRAYLVIIGVLAVMKLGFSALVPVTRQLDTGAAEDKALGIEIADLTKGKSLYRFGDVRMSLGIVFYLERDRQEPLMQTDDTRGDFYFIYPDDIPNFTDHFEIIKRFNYWENEIFLIEITD